MIVLTTHQLACLYNMPSHAAIAWCYMIITIMQATWHKSDWHVDKPQKTFDVYQIVSSCWGWVLRM